MRVCFYLLLTFLVFPITYTQAQQLLPLDEEGYFDDLQEIAAKPSDDSVKAFNQLLIAEYWMQKDSLRTQEALQKAIALGKTYPAFQDALPYYQGVYAQHYGLKSAALKSYEQALAGLRKHKDGRSRMLAAASWYQYAYLQTAEKGYDYLVDIITKHCIPLSKDLERKELLAYYYTQLGLTFMSVGQFEKAQEQHLEALAILSKVPEQGIVHFITYCNLVSNYCYKPDSKSAKVYLDKAAILIHDFPNSQQYSNFYYQQGMYYTTIQDFPKALAALEKGVAFAREKGQSQLLQLLKFRVYNIYLVQKDYPKAKMLLENILQEKLLIRESVNRKIVYTQLAKVNEVMGNFPEAYQWLTKSAHLSDSLQQVNLLAKMNELEIVHQTAEKQNKIDGLEREKIEASLLAKNRNLRISTLLVGLILLSVILLLLYNNYGKQKKLNQQLQINHQQQLLQLEKDRNFEAVQAILKGEDQERERLAQDLHDSMGGMLASLRMGISSDMDAQSSLKQPAEILYKLDQAIAEMRRISRNLMPETLKNMGLETALQELCASMAHADLPIQFEAFGMQHPIAFEKQLGLYRIAQESICNTLKYAQASHIIVQLSQDQDRLSMTIEDNGQGFAMDKVQKGMGLKNMENRARLIQGELHISAAIGEGTSINVECNVR